MAMPTQTRPSPASSSSPQFQIQPESEVRRQLGRSGPNRPPSTDPHPGLCPAVSMVWFFWPVQFVPLLKRPSGLWLECRTPCLAKSARVPSSHALGIRVKRSKNMKTLFRGRKPNYGRKSLIRGPPAQPPTDRGSPRDLSIRSSHPWT